jgi:PAS domain S-box-containing protein
MNISSEHQAVCCASFGEENMEDKLNILFLEDNLLDVELEVAALEEEGIKCVWERVDGREDFLREIEKPYDLIISDHSLPNFDGITAVRLLRQLGLDTPLIFVSGTVGEETAIESLKAGATDYVLKDRLSRLGPVARRALREYEEQTALKQTEEALKESEEKTRSIFEGALDAIVIIDPASGRIIEMNPATARLLGYRRDEFIGKHFSIFFPPSSLLSPGRMLEELQLRGAIFDSQDLLCADGSLCPVDMSISVIEWGRHSAILAMLRDVTERKRSEEALREAKRRYEELVNSIEGIVWECDPVTFEFSFVSRQAERLLGYPIDRWLSDPDFWPNHLHDDDREWLIDACKKTAGLPHKHEFEYRMIAADGRAVWLRDICSLVAGNGHPPKVRGVMVDITSSKEAEEERKRLEEQLLQAQKMESIGRLAGGVAHDFNNLLTAIIGYSQLVLARMGQEDGFRKEIEEVLRAGQRAASLTSQLLAFSRRQKLERKVINVDDTINNMIKMLRRIIGEDVDVAVHTAAVQPFIFADPSQVEQVLLNLAVNARDAMPEGGSLTIETDNVEFDEGLCHRHLWARLGRFVRLAVKDTGTGMDGETLKRIFEPFFTTKESGKGTGLGLAVVYGVVNQHDGLINVRSEPERGTCFEIYFPLHSEDAGERSDEKTLPARGGKETILVAEDEESLQDLTRKILTKLGYRVLMAKDGMEALEMFEASDEEIALVILDMVMPRMSGREVYLRLRAAGSDVPVIFMTGYSADVIDTNFVESLGIPLLRKPYDINELARRVRATLDQQEQARGKSPTA